MNNARTERTDPVVAELYKLKPHSLDVYTRDEDKPRRVPLGGRNRWARVKSTLDALPWDRIVALDAKGGVLGAIEPEDDELRETSALDDLTIAERLGHVVTDAIARTQAEDRKVFADHFAATAELINSMSAGVRAIVEFYSVALRMASSVAARPEGNDGLDADMMQMLMPLIASKLGIPPQALAALAGRGGFTGFAPPPPVVPKPPTNGATPPPKQPPKPPTNGAPK